MEGVQKLREDGFVESEDDGDENLIIQDEIEQRKREREDEEEEGDGEEVNKRSRSVSSKLGKHLFVWPGSTCNRHVPYCLFRIFPYTPRFNISRQPLLRNQYSPDFTRSSDDQSISMVLRPSQR